MTTPERIDRGPGFYRKEQGGLAFGTSIYGPGYILTPTTPQSIDGWAWFETEAQAESVLVGEGALDPAQVVVRRNIEDYLLVRRARLNTIRTQAQAIAVKTAFPAGTLTAAQLSTNLRDIQADVKRLAEHVDDLSQFDIRLSRRVLALYEGTD